MSEQQENQEDITQTPAVTPETVYEIPGYVQERKIKGIALGTGNDSTALQSAIEKGKIKIGPDLGVLRDKGVRGRAASTYQKTFYGEGLINEQGFLARISYSPGEGETILANMTSSQRIRWANEVKRATEIYGSRDPDLLSLNGEAFTNQDISAMELFLQISNTNQLTVNAMLEKISTRASIFRTTGTPPRISTPEEVGYFLNQASLTLTGKPITKAEADRMYKSFVQMERSNAAKNMDAPNKQLSAQSMVTKANPQEAAGYSVGKAIELAFRRLSGN